ncbi:hypothetical protein PKF032_18090 [Polynucleobacter yangtzensis]|uniref:Uncharacterized protein n=1 Tax=Polynucleobacter yangtzensis TaxID=1743159 RepID=A0ABM8CPT3_9BURK|nr:hypothetical protein PKF032_18090 [Polynucleobacter yangtzensis]
MSFLVRGVSVYEEVFGASGCLKSGPTAHAERTATQISGINFKLGLGLIDKNMGCNKYPLLQELFEHKNVIRAP